MKADSSDHISDKIPNSIQRALEKRRQDGNLRQLIHETDLVDFSSNDYLGLSHNQQLSDQIEQRLRQTGWLKNGGTGSRLISGNHKYYLETEKRLSEIFDAEACLLFNSGYAANQTVVSCIPQRGDTILYDQLAHVCLKEGAWLSKADSFAFLHNDLNDLETRMTRAKGNIYVVTETIFSMDGDIAPLYDIITLCEKYGAWLIVDEAHSTGAYGKSGAGWLVEKSLHHRILARVYTFGKAMGVHGACVAGSRKLIDYLINFGRSFIYTTSLPPHSVISIDESFRFLASHSELQAQLRDRINHFRSVFGDTLSHTAIQPVMVSGNEQARESAKLLQQNGLDVRAILAPTVKEGAERLRISLHVHNSMEEISQLVKLLSELPGS